MFSEENPPNIFKHPVIVSLDFICQSVENNPTEYIYSQEFLVFFNTIAGQCRTNPWPAVLDWPWCRNADAELKKLTASKSADVRLTFIRHSGIYMWFSTSYSKNKPATATYGCAGYITFTTTPFRKEYVLCRTWVYSFSPPAVQGVYIFFHHQQYRRAVQCVPLSTARHTEVQGVFLSATSSVKCEHAGCTFV